MGVGICLEIDYNSVESRPCLVRSGPQHCLGVEPADEFPIAVHGNHSAAARRQTLHDPATGPAEVAAAVADEGGDAVGSHVPDEDLAVSGAGDGAVLARVESAPGQAGVADAAERLARDAPGRGAGGQVSMNVLGCNSIDILDGLNQHLNPHLNYCPVRRLPKRRP